MSRRLLAVSISTGGAAFLLFALFFANASWKSVSNSAALAATEIAAVIQNPQTQRLVFLGLGIYFTAFLVLRFKAEAARCTHPGSLTHDLLQRNAASICLACTLVVSAVHYAIDHSSSVSAVILLAGAALNQWIAFWSGPAINNAMGKEQSGRILRSLFCFVSLLALASVWNPDFSYSYAYRSHSRWTGPWGNPNIFGLLMGTGIVLALGCTISILKFRVFDQKIKGNKKSGTRSYLGVLFCSLAVVLMSRGLLHSYSRGAWLATVCGIGCLAVYDLQTASSMIQGVLRCSCGGWLKRNWLSAVLITASVAVLVFWHFRQASWHPASRVFSVTRTEDFSWRNRLTAWEGALQITAEYPWIGAGWNQPELLYEHYYLPAKSTDCAAIGMNDYLILSATLGVPALFCFGGYLWLSLFGKSGVRSRGSGMAELEWLRATCHTGVIVLLIGFWFDGGLFKLPTAVTFWILLGLGSGNFRKLETSGSCKND